MIVGSGMMAKAFSEYENNENVLVFAQGVSNSREIDEKKFRRESDKLISVLEENLDKTVIYFGTCSVNDPESRNTPYVQHKLAMEKLIEQRGLDYYIFRLPQVVGQTNSPTLINFMATKIKNGEMLEIWKNSARNLIDVNDVFKIISYLIDNNLYKNSVINIASKTNTPILKILNILESCLNKKAKYVLLDKGQNYSININKIESLLEKLDIFFDHNYVKQMLEKNIKNFMKEKN